MSSTKACIYSYSICSLKIVFTVNFWCNNTELRISICSQFVRLDNLDIYWDLHAKSFLSLNEASFLVKAFFQH